MITTSQLLKIMPYAGPRAKLYLTERLEIYKVACKVLGVETVA